MYRNICALFYALWFVVIATIAPAHEYWIEPDRFFVPPGGQIEAQVRIGQNLEGKGFVFEPRAYQIALWVGPDEARDLTRARLRSGETVLAGMGKGLHRLAVTSYPQKLVYPTFDDFAQFAASIGDPGLAVRHKAGGFPLTDIREQYRRLSKTLVHFESYDGADNRLGLQREWVKGKGQFTLFDGTKPAAQRQAELFCEQGSGVVSATKQTLITDAKGSVAPILPENARCLLNAVFLEQSGLDGGWKSDWVSLFFKPTPLP